MKTCFSCQTELPERAIYCKSCGTQVRCKNSECHDLLEPDAQICITCGTPIGGGVVATTADSNGNGTHTRAVNTVVFEETPKRRFLRANLTDESVEHLSQPLGMFVTHRAEAMSRKHRTSSQIPEEEDRQLSLLDTGSEIEGQDGTGVIDVEPQRTLTPGTDREKLRRFFSFEGERARLIDSRLKAKSKRDQGQRLAVLSLYAHEQEGRSLVPRASLTDILGQGKVNDGNIRFWIGKADEFLTEDNRIGLSGKGRDRAQTVLAEALDPEKKDSWSPSTTSSQGRNGKSGAAVSDKKGKAKSAGGKRSGISSVVAEWKKKWEALGLSINAFKLINDRKLIDKGIFGLWAIRKAAGEEGKVVSRGKLKSFLHEAFEVPVDERHLERALQSKDAKGMVMKVTGGYQIQPGGMDYIEQIAGLTKGAPQVSSKGAAKK